MIKQLYEKQYNLCIYITDTHFLNPKYFLFVPHSC